MSVSSGSDVTIPIQDSPPPPPSPYGNRAQAESERKTPEPRGDVGVDNAAYEPCENDDKKGNANKTKDKSHKKGDHTQIPMNGQEPPLLNEALNSELINMNIMNTIPDKPQPEFGPYENPDEYFIAVNQHKKFLRRSEKLYVTKDKRKVNSWKKYVCWLMGAIILASIVTVAVLAGLGLISQKSQSSFTESGTTSPSELISSSLSPILSASSDAADEWISNGLSSTLSSSSSSTENIPNPLATRPPLPDNHHVPAAADITVTLDNAEYTAALNNKSSDRFHELATEIEQEMRRALTQNAGLSSVYAKVTEFLPGSVVVKMRLSWMDETKDLMDVQVFMATLRNLGPYQIRSGATTSYGLVNHCKFGNYGCSHYCTFDYEQLDFLCTCPELLSLADDKKTCIENLQFSSTSASIASIGVSNDTEQEVLPESETTLQPESEIPVDEHHIVSEPPAVVQPVSTEDAPPELEHASSPVADSASNDSIDEPPSEVSEEKETQGENPTSEDGHAPIVVPVASSTESEVENSGNDSTSHIVNDQTSDSGVGETAQEEPTESRDSTPEHEASAQRKTPDIVIPIVATADNESSVADRNTPSVIEGEGRDDLMETTLPPIHTQDDIFEDPNISPTESPVISQSSSAVNTSEEESSIGAPLQRVESDNYSEVEKHQQINDTVNTTTAGPPIVSFNNSRYSEERNISHSLSEEVSQSQSEELPISHRNVLLVSSNSSEPNHGEIASSETEAISGDVPANNTRSKSARFESYGEDQPSTTPTNASARHILTNSAEFMVYGDNVLNSSPAQNQPGTDSGLTDHEFSQHRSPGLGRLNTNNTENSEESQTTEANQNESSGSVEVVSSEADASAPKDDSASIFNSDERAGIVFTGNDSNDAGSTDTPRPRETEELTTPMPINLENDTLVNENATEDKTNAEPIVISGNGREVEVSITTTPFTPEEPAQDDPETTVSPVSTPATPSTNITEVEVPVSVAQANPDSEVVPTTIAPLEETTIVSLADDTDETATTIPDVTTSSTTTTTTATTTTSTTTTTTTTTTPAPVSLNDAPSNQPSGVTPEIANNASTVNNESSNATSGNAPANPSSNLDTNIQLSNSFSPELDANSNGRSNSSGVTVDDENELS